MQNGKGRRYAPPAGNSADFDAGFVAGMDRMESEAELQFDLGYRAGRVAVARELGDMTLVEPTKRPAVRS